MKFVLWGRYCADALTKRGPYREQHLAGLREQHARGMLLTLGPTAGSTHVFGVYEAPSQEEVEALVKGDIYWAQGIWTQVDVYPWTDAIPFPGL